MRYLILSLCCAGVLAGCQSHKAVEENSTVLTATLPPVDTEKNQGYLISIMLVVLP
jgi:hypothetical protein